MPQKHPEAKKPKKRIRKRIGAWLIKRKLIRNAKNVFYNGRYHQEHRRLWAISSEEHFNKTYAQGIQMLIQAGHSDIAKEMVARELRYNRKRLQSAQVELKDLGEIPKNTPRPSFGIKQAGVRTPGDAGIIHMQERAAGLDSVIRYYSHSLNALERLHKTMQ